MSKKTPIALGQWSKAPLVFVLAQVRYAPSNLANFDAIKDALRSELLDEFARTNALMSIGMDVGPRGLDMPPNTGSPIVVGYDLFNDDGSAVIRVMPDSLTYAVTHYIDFAHFSKKWMQILSVLNSVGIKETQRQGLRYVDFIYPSVGHEAEDYFCPPIDHRKTSKIGGVKGEPENTVLIQEFALDMGRLRVQYARGMGQPSLPFDLHGLLPLPHSSFRMNHDQSSAVFDTDRWVERVCATELTALKERFDILHKDISSAFKESITQLAKDEWTSSAKDD